MISNMKSHIIVAMNEMNIHLPCSLYIAQRPNEKINVINRHNHSKKQFNENAWKNSRKPERASQMLPIELIKPLLEEFDYVLK